MALKRVNAEERNVDFTKFVELLCYKPLLSIVSADAQKQMPMLAKHLSGKEVCTRDACSSLIWKSGGHVATAFGCRDRHVEC